MLSVWTAWIGRRIGSMIMKVSFNSIFLWSYKNQCFWAGTCWRWLGRALYLHNHFSTESTPSWAWVAIELDSLCRSMSSSFHCHVQNQAYVPQLHWLPLNSARNHRTLGIFSGSPHAVTAICWLKRWLCKGCHRSISIRLTSNAPGLIAAVNSCNAQAPCYLGWNQLALYC